MYTDIEENNEYFDVTSYPEKADKALDKQGITIKGSDQEFLDASKALRALLEAKDGRSMKVMNLESKMTGFKKEKDGMKCTANLEIHGS